MQAQAFIAKWGAGGPAHDLNERAGAQAHFIDLCRVLGVPEPGDAENYCFERGVTRTGAGQGFADVWLRNHFAWEYKAPGKSLDGALRQLMMYALPLDNPPLLVVSDRLRIEIHTHFTGTPSERHVFLLEDITRPDVQHRLRALWLAPDSFKPRRSNRQITEEAASTFADTAKQLRDAGVPADAVSHFLTQCVFAKRTLTHLYNQRPAWLANAHAALDASVAAAYGWADYSAAMPDDEILRRLLALNLARAGLA